MIKHIISKGIGFSPGSTRFVVTNGFSSAISVYNAEPVKSFTLDRKTGFSENRTTEFRQSKKRGFKSGRYT